MEVHRYRRQLERGHADARGRLLGGVGLVADPIADAGRHGLKPDPSTIAPLLVDALRLAGMLNVSLRTVRTWNSTGTLPAPMGVGGKVMWSVREIEEWIAAGTPDRAAWNEIKGGKRR